MIIPSLYAYNVPKILENQPMAVSRVSHVPFASANGEGIGTGGIAKTERAQMEVLRVEKKMFER